MRQFHYLLLLLASFVFITACSDDDFHANPLLKISKTSLEFNKTASQASVDVTTNKNDEFYAMVDGDQGAGWVKIAYTDGGFNVIVDENATSASRTATITLLLKKGTLPAPVTVKVKQSKDSEVTLALSEGDSHYPSAGGGVTVYLSGNFARTAWTVNSNADWIILDANGLDYKFTLKTIENPLTETRTATITVITEQGATAAINISQDARMTWQLPYIEMGYNLKTRGYAYPNNMPNVEAHEAPRGGVFLRGVMGMMYNWSSNSSLISQYQYRTPQGLTTLMDVMAMAITTDFMYDPLYWEYLESEGFKLTYADEKTDSKRRVVFWNQEREVAAVHNIPSKTITFLWARHELHHPVTGQIRPCTTFEVFPPLFTDFTATLPDIDAWEATQNSEQLARGKYVYYTYTPDISKTKELCVERIYSFKDDGTLKETWVMYEDIELVFFRNGNTNAYIATNEFKALMEAEGYLLVKEEPLNGIWYSNPTTEIDAYACIRGYSSESGLPRLIIQFTPLGERGTV